MQRRGLRLDRDAALALDVHRVEHLRFHLAVGQAAAALDQAIGQRALAVVDVGDDREVADVIHAARSIERAQARGRRRRLPCQRELASRSDARARRRRAEAKKKARRMSDAPSNKTYGNCLLGLHCSQKDPAGSRAIA